MRNDPSLWRLVVVRRDDEDPIDTDRVGTLGEMHGMRGVVGARSCDDGELPADLVDGNLVEREALVIGECRRLAGRPCDDDTV